MCVIIIRQHPSIKKHLIANITSIAPSSAIQSMIIAITFLYMIPLTVVVVVDIIVVAAVLFASFH
jgi:hypothetical protein